MDSCHCKDIKATLNTDEIQLAKKHVQYHPAQIEKTIQIEINLPQVIFTSTKDLTEVAQPGLKETMCASVWKPIRNHVHSDAAEYENVSILKVLHSHYCFQSGFSVAVEALLFTEMHAR